jgi:hypothetical protein
MTRWWLPVVVLSVAHAQQSLSPPVELDHIVSTVNSTKIWKSDVRQARMLKLFGADVTHEDAVLTELQNRALVLAEMTRGQAYEPTADALAAKRREWEGSLGATEIDKLLARAGMKSAEVDAWLRTDLRIQRFLSDRFSTLPPDQRGPRQRDWIRDLRQRAGLR